MSALHPLSLGAPVTGKRQPKSSASGCRGLHTTALPHVPSRRHQVLLCAAPGPGPGPHGPSTGGSAWQPPRMFKEQQGGGSSSDPTPSNPQRVPPARTPQGTGDGGGKGQAGKGQPRSGKIKKEKRGGSKTRGGAWAAGAPGQQPISQGAQPTGAPEPFPTTGAQGSRTAEGVEGVEASVNASGHTLPDAVSLASAPQAGVMAADVAPASPHAAAGQLSAEAREEVLSMRTADVEAAIEANLGQVQGQGVEGGQGQGAVQQQAHGKGQHTETAAALEGTTRPDETHTLTGVSRTPEAQGGHPQCHPAGADMVKAGGDVLPSVEPPAHGVAPSSAAASPVDTWQQLAPATPGANSLDKLGQPDVVSPGKAEGAKAEGAEVVQPQSPLTPSQGSFLPGPSSEAEGGAEGSTGAGRVQQPGYAAALQHGAQQQQQSAHAAAHGSPTEQMPSAPSHGIETPHATLSQTTQHGGEGAGMQHDAVYERSLKEAGEQQGTGPPVAVQPEEGQAQALAGSHQVHVREERQAQQQALSGEVHRPQPFEHQEQRLSQGHEQPSPPLPQPQGAVEHEQPAPRSTQPSSTAAGAPHQEAAALTQAEGASAPEAQSSQHEHTDATHAAASPHAAHPASGLGHQEQPHGTGHSHAPEEESTGERHATSTAAQHQPAPDHEVHKQLAADKQPTVGPGQADQGEAPRLAPEDEQAGAQAAGKQLPSEEHVTHEQTPPTGQAQEQQGSNDHTGPAAVQEQALGQEGLATAGVEEVTDREGLKHVGLDGQAQEEQVRGGHGTVEQEAARAAGVLDGAQGGSGGAGSEAERMLGHQDMIQLQREAQERLHAFKASQQDQTQPQEMLGHGAEGAVAAHTAPDTVGGEEGSGTEVPPNLFPAPYAQLTGAGVYDEEQQQQQQPQVQAAPPQPVMAQSEMEQDEHAPSHHGARAARAQSPAAQGFEGSEDGGWGIGVGEAQGDWEAARATTPVTTEPAADVQGAGAQMAGVQYQAPGQMQAAQVQEGGTLQHQQPVSTDTWVATGAAPVPEVDMGLAQSEPEDSVTDVAAGFGVGTPGAAGGVEPLPLAGGPVAALQADGGAGTAMAYGAAGDMPQAGALVPQGTMLLTDPITGAALVVPAVMTQGNSGFNSPDSLPGDSVTVPPVSIGPDAIAPGTNAPAAATPPPTTSVPPPFPTTPPISPVPAQPPSSPPSILPPPIAAQNVPPGPTERTAITSPLPQATIEREKANTGVGTMLGAATGALIGVLVGPLAGPVGAAVGASIGAAVGGSIAGGPVGQRDARKSWLAAAVYRGHRRVLAAATGSSALGALLGLGIGWLAELGPLGAVVGAALGGLVGAALGASGMAPPEPDLGTSDDDVQE